MDDSARTGKAKVATKKRGGSVKSRGGGGSLPIPAVLNLNAGRSWKRHPRLPPLSTCQNLGKLSLPPFLTSLLLFLY
jgi:hypothetical protein